MGSTMGKLAKGASIFLVGGVLGGVMTYNTLSLGYRSGAIGEENVVAQEVSTDATTTTTGETTTALYTPSEAVNTVVSIDVTLKSTDGFINKLFGEQEIQASGSGVIYSEDENGIYIITNNHVVEGADSITIRLDDDDEPAEASLIGRDPNNDLAVIYVTKDELESKNIDNYLISHIGDSDELSVFDKVYAVGNAAGEGKSGTSGTISALDKDVTTEDGNDIEAIQIDAAINPGNSGGALLNENGELVGINFAKIVGTDLEGMGYSIPINDALVVVNEIIKEGTVENPVVLGVESKPFLGVSLFEMTKETAEQQGLRIDDDAVVVASVVPNSPAYNCGIEVGDVIVSLDGEDIDSIDELHEVLYKHDIGDTVSIGLLRNLHDTIDTTITIGNSALFE